MTALKQANNSEKVNTKQLLQRTAEMLPLALNTKVKLNFLTCSFKQSALFQIQIPALIGQIFNPN